MKIVSSDIRNSARFTWHLPLFFCSSFFCLKGHFWADLKLPNIRSNTSFRCLANIGKCILKDQWRTVAVNWIQLAPKEAELSKIRLGHWIILDPFSKSSETPKFQMAPCWTRLLLLWGCLCRMSGLAAIVIVRKVQRLIGDQRDSVKSFRCPEMLHATWEHQVKLRHSVHNHGTFQRGAWREGTLRLLSSTFTLPNHTKAKAHQPQKNHWTEAVNLDLGCDLGLQRLPPGYWIPPHPA